MCLLRHPGDNIKRLKTWVHFSLWGQSGLDRSNQHISELPGTCTHGHDN